MKHFVEKLVALERQIAAEKGVFALFALFLREDAPDKWGLVAAAPWVEDDKKIALGYIAERLQAELSPEELLVLSRIVLVDLDDPALETIHKTAKVEHGIFEVEHANFFGLEMQHGYIVTSKKNTADMRISHASTP